MSVWFVYMLRCADDTFYAGITTNLERRLREHNGELKGRGAKCTRARRPVVLVYQEKCVNRSEASKREAAIKKMSREEKCKLLQK